MRGKILQYNGSDGSGIVVINGQQNKFNITSWRGDTAPAVGTTVDDVLADGAVESLSAVGDEVLLREKAGELSGKFGGLMDGLIKPGESGAGGSIVERYGKFLLIGYGIFFLSSLLFNFFSIQVFGVGQGSSLFNLSGGLGQVGGGGGVKFLVLLAWLSVAVPFFWADKRAWLALLMPLLSVLWAFVSLRIATGPMGSLISEGIGFYLTLASSLYIAAMGVKRFRG
jgi:hypothetical protein